LCGKLLWGRTLLALFVARRTELLLVLLSLCLLCLFFGNQAGFEQLFAEREAHPADITAGA
jgi:hypothetical protein